MKKRETCEYLIAAGVAFEITEHPAVFNMAEASQIQLPYPDREAKNLFVRDDKKRAYYLITVMGGKRVDLKAFRKKHQTRPLKFASEEELAQILRLIPGAVTPLGILNDEGRCVKWFIDEEFLEGNDLIGVHPNENTATVWLKTEELVRIVKEHGNRTEIIKVE